MAAEAAERRQQHLRTAQPPQPAKARWLIDAPLAETHEMHGISVTEGPAGSFGGAPEQPPTGPAMLPDAAPATPQLAAHLRRMTPSRLGRLGSKR